MSAPPTDDCSQGAFERQPMSSCVLNTGYGSCTLSYLLLSTFFLLHSPVFVQIIFFLQVNYASDNVNTESKCVKSNKKGKITWGYSPHQGLMLPCAAPCDFVNIESAYRRRGICLHCVSMVPVIIQFVFPI